jgi:peptidoglycan-associated lipoprotein
LNNPVLPFHFSLTRRLTVKKLLIPALLMSVMLAACESTPTEEAAVEDNSANAQKVTPVQVRPTARSDSRDLAPWATDPSKASVYFDYDSYTIRSEARPVIETNARYLTSHNDVRVLIQGNTDERGSREYNLALGQKRANAVRQSLKLLGVSDVQIEAVSLGKERPACTEVTESCYSRNRRGDFVLR